VTKKELSSVEKKLKNRKIELNNQVLKISGNNQALTRADKNINEKEEKIKNLDVVIRELEGKRLELERNVNRLLGQQEVLNKHSILHNDPKTE